MAVRRPLVVIGGQTQQLPAGDTLPSAGGGGLSGLATVSAYQDNYYIEEAVAAPGVAPANRIIAAIAPHAETDDNHEALLNLQVISAGAGTNEIIFRLTFNEPTDGAIKVNWSAS